LFLSILLAGLYNSLPLHADDPLFFGEHVGCPVT
jgi:hypothetical protein